MADTVSGAKAVREYQPAYILSSLRIRQYIEAERPRPDASVVTHRLRQQAVLSDGTIPFQLVMNEGALRWNVGGRGVMSAQLTHIADVARRPWIELGIIPTGTPVDFFAGHAFHIYRDAEVVVGTLTERRTYNDPDTVARYLESFARLRAVAVFGGPCLDVIDRAQAALADLE